MLRDNRNSSNCFQKPSILPGICGLLSLRTDRFQSLGLCFCCSNNLFYRFWIIWPQVIHFLFCFLLTFSVVFVDNFCFVDISVFVDTKCCHISGAIPCYTVLLLFDCPIEANDRFMVLRRDVIRLKKVTFASFLWFISYDSNNMLHEPLWRLLQNKLLGFLWRFFSD